MNTHVLIATVGTGTAERFEDTVLLPFRKTFEEGEWTTIHLLCSRATEGIAQRLLGCLPEFAKITTVHTLAKSGEEFNVDLCFALFDRVIEGIRAEGVPASALCIDMTRGTKVMSAALTLAGVVHGIREVRYLEGELKDASGVTVGSSERVNTVVPERISFRYLLDRARTLLRHGQFRAVLEILPARSRDPDLRDDLQWARWLAEFWGAWDDFHYREALDLIGRQPTAPAPARWVRWSPRPGQVELLAVLSQETELFHAAPVLQARAVCADVLANADRRLKRGEHEETVVRIYRVLEGLGQIRLFQHGYSSDRVPTADPNVREWIADQERRKKLNYNAPKPGRDGCIPLARQNVGSFLKYLKDPLAGKLNKPDEWLPGFDANLRNHSILAHGFVGRSAGKEIEIPQWLDAMERVFESEDPGNGELLRRARFPML